VQQKQELLTGMYLQKAKTPAPVLQVSKNILLAY
jgi:hypothetical protein